MRGKTFDNPLQRQATIDEYIKAVKSGAVELAARIRAANSGDELETGWVPIDWKALDEFAKNNGLQ